MNAIAELLWNPALSLWYLVVGVVLAAITGGMAWRRGPTTALRLWRTSRRHATDRQLGHQHAFLSALAAGIGVGNLAGVATALHLGGPGALFWMWVSALLGMTMRMSSTYLTLRTQPQDRRSALFATPMAYLERLLPAGLRALAPAVAGLLLVKGLVTANLIQSNSVAHALSNEVGTSNLVVAALLALAVGVVIIGGLRSIVRYSAWLAPLMLVSYLVAGLMILGADAGRTWRSLVQVFEYAVHPYAIGGGGVGYAVLRTMQYGISRGVFSHGSGIGIAPFLHAANRDRPAHGALMASVVPLVDTLLVCSVTGLVILSHGDFHGLTGAYLTVSSYQQALGPFGRVLIVACLVLFAFTTMTNWAHFAERCFEYLGGRSPVAFRSVFVAVTFVGPFLPVAMVWWIGDVLIGALIALHLLPLLYGTIRCQATMRAELSGLEGAAGVPGGALAAPRRRPRRR